MMNRGKFIRVIRDLAFCGFKSEVPRRRLGSDLFRSGLAGEWAVRTGLREETS
jgi:hypothetical protein